MYKYYKLFDILCLALIYFLYFFPRWKSGKKELFLKTVFYVYISSVLYFTLMPFIIPIPFINFSLSSVTANLMPFNDFLEGHGGAAKEFLLNIIMMTPLGILMPFIWKKKFLETLKYVFVLSLIIEFFQLFSNGGLRSFDTTDLISNTLGGMIGFLIYLIFHPLADWLISKLFKDTPPVYQISRKTTKKERIIFIVIAVQLLVRSVLAAYM